MRSEKSRPFHSKIDRYSDDFYFFSQRFEPRCKTISSRYFESYIVRLKGSRECF